MDFISTVRLLEKAITSGLPIESCEVTRSESMDMGNCNDTDSDSSDSETENAVQQPKKLKVAGLH